jgi:hypothetical protein
MAELFSPAMGTAASSRGASAVSAGTPACDYFDRMVEAFAAAVDGAGGSLVRSMGVADARVDIVLAGAALAPVLIPALAHLELPSGPPADLTVLAFDTASTGIAPPAAPDDEGEEGSVVRVLQRGARLFSMLHRERALAVVWTEDAARVPWNEIAAPLRMVWQPWFAARGWQLVHGGAVGTAAGGVLVGGRSGAGKSTTVLACLEAGMEYAADDYVLATAMPAPALHSLYASAKLQEEQLERFPRLAAQVANRRREPGEKPVILLAESHRSRLRARMPLRAVVIPAVTGTARPVAQPISAAEALAAVAPSTLFQLPFERGAALGRLRRLVEACPCFRLETGPDLAVVAAAVRDLLEDRP